MTAYFLKSEKRIIPLCQRHHEKSSKDILLQNWSKDTSDANQASGAAEIARAHTIKISFLTS
jgi:hypothetical protein